MASHSLTSLMWLLSVTLIYDSHFNAGNNPSNWRRWWMPDIDRNHQSALILEPWSSSCSLTADSSNFLLVNHHWGGNQTLKFLSLQDTKFPGLLDNKQVKVVPWSKLAARVRQVQWAHTSSAPCCETAMPWAQPNATAEKLPSRTSQRSLIHQVSAYHNKLFTKEHSRPEVLSFIKEKTPPFFSRVAPIADWLCFFWDLTGFCCSSDH